ncbi:hypothetical protein GF362_05520 [Candidatus Dojkabacteria bacterium]|nr:hypothetical protein [Candidatus Dojkabacteria bacterium]
MKKKRLFFRKAVATATAIAAGLAPLAFNLPTVKAAAVNVAASPTELTASGGEVTFSYTVDQVEATGASYVFTYVDSEGTSLSQAPADCTTGQSTDIVPGTANEGAGSFSHGVGSSTFTLTEQITAGAKQRSICIDFGPESSTSVSVAITSSGGDFGAVLVHFDDNNDVTVTANIAPTLSFNIRDLADSADVNTCDLGTVDTSTDPNQDTTDDGVGECGYGLAVGTNAQGGFSVSYDIDAGLNNASATINDAAEDDTSTAGTEDYGLVNITAAQTGRDTATGNYDQTIYTGTAAAGEDEDDSTDYTPVKSGGTTIFSWDDGIDYTAGTDATDLSLLMHGITVGSGTPAGSYDQVVTFTVTATF